MDDINVIIATKIDDMYLRKIADVDKRLKIWDIADFIAAELRWIPGTEASATERKELDGILRNAEVILWPRTPRARTPEARKETEILS